MLGLDFHNSSLGETTLRILSRPRGARFAYVVTPNADHIVRLWRIPRLRAVYLRAMLCLLDSQFIGLFARRLGLAHPPVVTGADLAAQLLERLENVLVAVIGMDDEAFDALVARYPRIEFLHHQPPMGLLYDRPAFYAARDFAVRSNAAYTFIAVGSPVQEILAYAIALSQESTGIGLCIGSALAFCAGSVRRAPLWMRERGLEWLYRFNQDPVRLASRYLLSDPKIILGLTIAKTKGKRK